MECGTGRRGVSGLPPGRALAVLAFATAMALHPGLPPRAASPAPAASSDTLAAEHRARRQRLEALARDRLGGAIALHDALVRRADLPAGIGMDVPVLRAVFPQRVFFDTDSEVLRPEALDAVAVVADALRAEASDIAVFVAGHTDDRAGDAYNLELSIRRAESVARALRERAVPQARLWRIGFGRAVPLVPNSSEIAMGQNRRVELILARRPEAVTAWLARQETLVCADFDARTRAGCRRVLAGSPRFEARRVGPDGDGPRTMAVTVRVTPVRAEASKAPVPVRLELPAPVPVNMGLPQVLVRRPDL